MRATADQHINRRAVDHVPPLAHPAGHTNAQDSLPPPAYDVHRSNDDYTEEASYSSSYDDSTETSIIAPSNAPHFLRLPMPNFSASKGASDLNATWQTFNTMNPGSAGAPPHDQLDDAFSESNVPHTLSVLTRWSGAYYLSPRQVAPRQGTVIAANEPVSHEPEGSHRVRTHDGAVESSPCTTQQGPSTTRHSTPVKATSNNAQATRPGGDADIVPCTTTPRANKTIAVPTTGRVVQDDGGAVPPLSPQVQVNGGESCNAATGAVARRAEGNVTAGAGCSKVPVTSQHATKHTPSHRVDLLPRIAINVPRRPLARVIPHSDGTAVPPPRLSCRDINGQAARGSAASNTAQPAPATAVCLPVMHNKGDSMVMPIQPPSPSRRHRRRAGVRAVPRQEVNICLVEYPAEGGGRRGAAECSTAGADKASSIVSHSVAPCIGSTSSDINRRGRSPQPARCPTVGTPALTSHVAPPCSGDDRRVGCQRRETRDGCTCNTLSTAEHSTSARTPVSLAITASYRGTSTDVTATKSSSMNKDAPPP